ncbi:MAG: hypothetical protein LBG46_06760 [Elusimicrobiota bacterium]|jgi:hypothetical protein|nr:hypothetical protein [Elusimicrobiota bacterium]
MYKKIQRSKDLAFVLVDFYKFSKDSDQIIRALRKLVKDKVLIKIGKGAYAKAKHSELTDNYMPAGGLLNSGRQVLGKFGIKTFPSSYDIAYNSGQSMQIPTGRVIGVNRRVSRVITFNGVSLKYEKI